MRSKLMLIVAIFTTVVIVMTITGNIPVVKSVLNNDFAYTVVIDPGHGGIDGGAESPDGVSEKNINLQIGLCLAELLEKENIKVIMTRTSDEGLYEDDGSAAIRTLKTQDMHIRKKIIDEADAELAVSIHLNSFSQDESVRGAQVFYPESSSDELTELSRQAAEMIQADLNAEINSVKKRSALPKDDVFILQDIKCPVIIAECGFLSNPQEVDKLSNHAYQGKIAKTLKAGICKFLKVKE